MPGTVDERQGNRQDFWVKLRRFGLLWFSAVTAILTFSVFLALDIFLPARLASGSVQFCFAIAIVTCLAGSAVGLHMTEKVGREILDRTSLALAVAAIVFAIWQFRDARAEEWRMEAISEQMTTRFIGMFPKSLDEINRILPNANSSLDIMVDFVGYGHYSAPKDFERYLRAIEDLRSDRSLPIRLLIYTFKKGQSVHDVQFPETRFNEAISNREKKLVSFVDKWNGGKLPATKKEFDHLLFERQRAYMAILSQRGVLIRATGDELPFYLWDQDDQEAVFAFLNEDIAGVNEASFWTRDRSLIVDTFKVRFCRMWNSAGPVDLTVEEWNAMLHDPVRDGATDCK